MLSTCSYKSSLPSCTAIWNGESALNIQGHIVAVFATRQYHDQHMLILRQRLHQPHRPLQPPEHLHHPRSRRPRFPDLPVPHQWILDCADSESASVGLEWKEVCSGVGIHYGTRNMLTVTGSLRISTCWTRQRSSGSSTCTRRYDKRGHRACDDWLTATQESFIKLGFHLLMFFFYLYSMIVALIRDESH
jgi:hypothetical protein